MMVAVPVLHPLPQSSHALCLLGGREKLKRTIAGRFGGLFNHISAAGLWTSSITFVSRVGFLILRVEFVLVLSVYMGK